MMSGERSHILYFAKNYAFIGYRGTWTFFLNRNIKRDIEIFDNLLLYISIADSIDCDFATKI